MDDGRKRAAIAQAWKQGRLRYKLNSRAMWLVDYDKIHAMPAGETYVLECGRRTGKSSLLMLLGAETCIQNPGCIVGYIAPVREKLAEYVQPIIFDLISDCPADQKPEWREKTCTLVFPNGSKIMFVGSNNKSYVALRGFKLKQVLADEGAFMDDFGFALDQVLRPALFDSQGKFIIGSTPPPTLDHEFIEIADMARAAGLWCHYTVYDAGYPLEWIEREKKKYMRKAGKGEADWRREYMAERIVDPTRAVIPEWKDEYVLEVPRDEFFQYYQYVVTLDLGWHDLTVVLWIYWDFKRAQLVVEDELVLKGPSMTTDLLVRAIRDRELLLLGDPQKIGTKKVHTRVADVNNPLILQDMARLHGMAFNYPSKDRLEAMVNELRMLVGKGGVAVSKRCPILIQTMKNAIWDDSHKEFERAATTGHADALAALLYGARAINATHNPIPADHAIDPRTHHIPPEALKSAEQNSFQKAFGLKPARTPLYGLRRQRWQ
jgi:hypothetical protein